MREGLINNKGKDLCKIMIRKEWNYQRDKVAIANYTEIIEGRGTKNGAVFLDMSQK